jgi:plastocyanin
MRHFFTSAALAAALLVPMAAAALGIQVIIDGQSITFVDVPQSAWFATYVHDAAEAGIVTGYKDASGKLTGKFGPEKSITVAEALKIASESAGYDESLYGTLITSGITHWASAYMSVAKGEHFAILSDRIRLDTPATRAQVASMFTSAFRVNVSATPTGTSGFNDVKMDTQYAASIEALAADKIVSGDTDVNNQATGTFRPLDPINRAEVVKIAMGARAKYGQPGKDRTPTNESGATLVLYRGTNGFVPSVLHVKLGTSVVFRNDSSESLRIASNPLSNYPELDSKNMIQPGAEYSFTFQRIGTWSFNNYMNPSRTGTIVVN